FAEFYLQDWTPISENSWSRRDPDAEPREKQYLNGLWLYAPAADPLYPPHLDFLLEHFDELSCQEISPAVTQHRFRNQHGRLRVTTDAAREEDGFSAWWLHADTESHLYDLARRVWDCGNLKENLKHWVSTQTEPAGRAGVVMERLRSGTSSTPTRP